MGTLMSFNEKQQMELEEDTIFWSSIFLIGNKLSFASLQGHDAIICGFFGLDV
jgi:hypothetical protein